MIISMETINKQEYIEYLQNLLVASYTMKPTPLPQHGGWIGGNSNESGARQEPSQS